MNANAQGGNCSFLQASLEIQSHSHYFLLVNTRVSQHGRAQSKGINGRRCGLLRISWKLAAAQMYISYS